MTHTDLKFMAKAKSAAELSDFGKAHIGCVAVYRNRVISVGYNSQKTHPVQKYYNQFRNNGDNDLFMPRLHAEIACLNNIRHLSHIDFSRIKLYIYRKRVDRPYSMARPCPSCMKYIQDFGIRNIFYTSDSGYIHEKIYNTPTKRGNFYQRVWN